MVRALVEAGVPDDALFAAGFGQNHPVCRQRQRREPRPQPPRRDGARSTPAPAGARTRFDGHERTRACIDPRSEERPLSETSPSPSVDEPSEDEPSEASPTVDEPSEAAPTVVVIDAGSVEDALDALEARGARGYDAPACDCVRALLTRAEELGGGVGQLFIVRAEAHVVSLGERFDRDSARVRTDSRRSKPSTAARNNSVTCCSGERSHGWPARCAASPWNRGPGCGRSARPMRR